MASKIDQLSVRITNLERRLAALERRGTQDAAASEPVEAPKPIAAVPPTVPTETQPPPASQPRAEALVRLTGSPDRPAVPAVQRSTKKDKPTDRAALEAMIGGKWFMVLGALVIVAGIGLFLKLAYDSGWLTMMSPAARCIATAVFGAVLLAVGEVSLRRLGRTAAAGFNAAGVAALFAAGYAAYAIFGILGEGAAFTALAGACAVGLGVALRARLVSVGALSLIGAYGTPLFFLDTQSPPMGLPAYLLGLLGVGLGLGLLVERFRPMTTLSWWGTVLLGTMWLGFRADEAPWVALVFVGIVWAAIHGAHAVMALRREKADDQPAPHLRVNSSMLTSLSTTSWATLAGLFVVDSTGITPVWIVPAALLAAAACGALVLAGHLRVMIDLPRTETERLGATLMTQAAGLLILTVALGVTAGWMQVSVWLTMGVTAMAGGRWVRARSLEVYGLVLLALGTTRLVLFESMLPGGLHTGGHEMLGLVLTRWSLLMAIAAAAWWSAGWLVRRDERESSRAMSAAAVLIGSAMLALAFVHEDAEVASVMAAWLGAAVLLGGLRFVLRPMAFDFAALATAGAALVAWIVAFPAAGWSGFDAVIGLHPGLWWGAATAAVLFAAAWLVGRRSDGWAATVRRIAITAAGLLMLAATSLEVAWATERLTSDPTMRAGAVSIWWGLVAVGLLVSGGVRKIAVLRHAGLGLLLVATIKVLTMDLAAVNPAIRVASFVGLGLLMLGVAAFYLRSGRERRGKMLLGHPRPTHSSLDE